MCKILVTIDLGPYVRPEDVYNEANGYFTEDGQISIDNAYLKLDDQDDSFFVFDLVGIVHEQDLLGREKGDRPVSLARTVPIVGGDVFSEIRNTNEDLSREDSPPVRIDPSRATGFSGAEDFKRK